MDQAEKNSMLRDEYLFLQQQYEDYDKRSLTIKGWVTSGAVAALALGISSDSDNSHLIPLSTALLALVVWYLETNWKIFQYGLRDRIRILEAHFRGDPDIIEKDPDPFQIYHWWFKSVFRDQPIYEYESEYRPQNKIRRFVYSAFQAFVMMPYLPIIVLCAFSFFII